MTTVAKTIGLVLGATAALTSTALRPYSDDTSVDLDTLCQAFPQDADCQPLPDQVQPVNPPANPPADSDYQIPTQPEATPEGAPGSAPGSQSTQVIKFKLPGSGSNPEWIRIEVTGNTLKMLHTTQTVSGFSRVANRILGFLSPVPLPNFYQWSDDQTTRIAFEPDDCLNSLPASKNQPAGSSICAITGSQTLTLPAGTNLHRGRFTLEYKNENVFRSVSFRLPNKNADSGN